MVTQLRTRVRSERGAALLETAITLPLLLFVTIGMLEFGRAYQTWQVLTNAAREGARIAVLPGSTDAAVRERVKTYIEAGQLPAVSDDAISITRDNDIAAGAITASGSRVAIAYPFQFMVLQGIAELVVQGSTVGEPLTMTAAALMRNE